MVHVLLFWRVAANWKLTMKFAESVLLLEAVQDETT